MTRTEPSPSSSDRTRSAPAAGASPAPAAPPGQADDELARAAAELEALADAYDQCSRSLEAMEATVDTLLDDRSTHVLVLDAERRILAVSRGMAALLGTGPPPLGQRVGAVVPPSWAGLDPALDTLPAEGWGTCPVDDGAARLYLRRATGDDRGAVYVVRYERQEP